MSDTTTLPSHPQLPPSRDRIYPQCVWCRTEQYGPAVLEFSRGQIACESEICGRFIPESYRLGVQS